MKLFLASYINNVSSQCVKLLGLSPQKDALAYIPTAQECYPDTETTRERGSYKAFSDVGFTMHILQPGKQDPQTIKKTLATCKAVIVAGGNTYYLLQELQLSGMLEVLKDFVSKGGAFIGSSAGSIVATEDISYIKDTDELSLALKINGFRGLGLVDVAIYPHCTDLWFNGYTEKTRDEILQSKNKRILLHDAQAMYVQDDMYKIIDANTDNLHT